MISLRVLHVKLGYELLRVEHKFHRGANIVFFFFLFVCFILSRNKIYSFGCKHWPVEKKNHSLILNG